VELINIEELQGFVNTPVQVSIQDEQGQERAPFVKKTIKKIELCPDGTHVRFYFDHRNFFAVPTGSSVMQAYDGWKANNLESGLVYVIKRV
jgi:hypothetical protein